MWDQLTIGYLAALIDGEGNIRINGHGVRIVVTSTDYDIVHRAFQMSGVGTIYGPYSYRSERHHKPRWEWSVSNHKDAARLLCAIAPLMSQRRRETQIMPVADYLSGRTHPRLCSVCDEPFSQSTRGIKKYCSDKCYRVKYNKRRRELRCLAPEKDPARFGI